MAVHSEAEHQKIQQDLGEMAYRTFMSQLEMVVERLEGEDPVR